MRIKRTQLDLNQTRAAWRGPVFAPAFVAARTDNTPWYVADSAIVSGAPMAWADASADEYIRIPLFQYNLPAKGDLALASIFHLGLIAAAQVGKPIEAIHIVTASPVELVYDTANNLTHMSYWFGFAVHTTA
jgi:hypothetical protein